MARVGLETDILESWNKFSSMTYTQMDRAIKRALLKGAKAIKEQTISNARAGIKSYNNKKDDPYNGDSILDAPRITKLEDSYDSDSLSLKVHVMGTRKSNSQTYRFRFLEKGTKVRQQKTNKGKALTKPRYTGRISARRYFGNALNSVNLDAIYQQEILDAVNKINQGE